MLYMYVHLPTFPTRSKMMLTVHCEKEGEKGREARGGERERERECEGGGERMY